MSRPSSLAPLGLLGVLFLPAPGRAFANPCVLDYVGGRNPLAEAPQRDIAIARETIAFDLRGARAREAEHLRGHVRIDYEFDNRGPAVTVVMGFPIGRYTDAFYPARDIVDDFEVRGAGAGPLLPAAAPPAMPIDRAGIQRCEGINAGPAAKDKGAAGYAWYRWRQGFPPGRTRLTVAYRLNLLSDWRSDSRAVIGYVLSTTAGWGEGRIGRLGIDFRVQGVPRPWKVDRGIPEADRPHPGQHLRFAADDFVPREDLRFVHLDPGEAADASPTTSQRRVKSGGPKRAPKTR